MKIFAVKVNKMIDQDSMVLFINGVNSEVKPAVEIYTKLPFILDKGDIVQLISDNDDRSRYEIIAIENDE